MSDVPDWQQTVGGNTRKVASGTIGTVGTLAIVPIAATDTALVVICNEVIVDNVLQVNVEGVQSGTDYGFTNQTPTTASAIFVFPVSGAIDSGVYVNITPENANSTYVVLASSDWVWQWANEGGMPVTVATGVTFEVLNQAIRAPANVTVTSVTTANQQVVPAPATNSLNVVKTIQWSGAASVAQTVNIRGVTTGMSYMAFAVAASGLPNPIMQYCDWPVAEALEVSSTAGTGIGLRIVYESAPES